MPLVIPPSPGQGGGGRASRGGGGASQALAGRAKRALARLREEKQSTERQRGAIAGFSI
jgi:hypothetical protein